MPICDSNPQERIASSPTFWRKKPREGCDWSRLCPGRLSGLISVATSMEYLFRAEWHVLIHPTAQIARLGLVSVSSFLETVRRIFRLFPKAAKQAHCLGLRDFLGAQCCMIIKDGNSHVQCKWMLAGHCSGGASLQRITQGRDLGPLPT